MKRRRPMPRYDGDLGYPSVTERRSGLRPGVGRRGFLTQAVAVAGAAAAAAAAGGTLALGGPDVQAGRSSGWAKIKLPFQHRLAGCKLRIDRLIAQSRDKRLVRFLAKKSEWPGIRKNLKATFALYKCADLHAPKRLARMEKKAAQGLVAHYSRRTGRPAKTLLLNVVASKPPRLRVYGFAAPPAPPANPLTPCSKSSSST